MLRSDLLSRSTTPLSECWAGSRAILPLVVGAVPFGILFGTLATGNGLSVAGALAMSLFVFAGSSQFIAVSLLATGTPLSLILLTTVIVNLRHLLYSLSLLPYIRQLPQHWKLLIGFWLTDEAFAVAIARYHQPDSSPYKQWFYVGASVLMYSNWQVCTLLGIWLGRQLPNTAAWGLDFAMSVTFIGMVIPYVKNYPMGVTVLVAGGVALLAHPLPHQLGLIVAALAGVAAGFSAERILHQGKTPSF